MLRLLLAVALVAVLVLTGGPVLREIGSGTSGVADRIATGLGVEGDGQGRTVRVTRVVDGDTIVVSGGERVRYIGVDTPESVKPDTPVQCFAEAAAARNRELVAGRRVRLVGDVEARDRFGRTLAYVYRVSDDAFVNAVLVRQGFARTLTIAPNVRHAAEFRRLAGQARRDGRGLWSQC